MTHLNTKHCTKSGYQNASRFSGPLQSMDKKPVNNRDSSLIPWMLLGTTIVFVVLALGWL